MLNSCSLSINSTPLERQTMQNRQYTENYHTVFAAVLNMFQDWGYHIKNKDDNTGFIMATSPIYRNQSLAINNNSYNGKNNKQILATIYFEQIGAIVNVRLNYVSNGYYAYGTNHDTPITTFTEPSYDDTFKRMDNAIAQYGSIHNNDSNIRP